MMVKTTLHKNQIEQIIYNLTHENTKFSQKEIHIILIILKAFLLSI